MTARAAVLAFTLAAVAGLLAAGCNIGGGGAPGNERATQRVERGVAPGQRAFVVDSYDGDVTLQDTTGQEARLTFIKRARSTTQEKARNLLERIRIEESGGEDEFAYKLASGAPDRTSVDVEGQVPQNTRVRLYLRNGDAAISGLRGPLDVSNENGDIRIGGAGRTTRAETRNGSVEVGMRGVPTGGQVRLRTRNGDLELTLPASASANVEARTDAGEIDASGLSFQDRSRSRNGAGARFEGTLGAGEAEVRLRTENGDITIRRGTVRRLPGLAADSAATPDSTLRDSTLRDSTARDSLGSSSDSLFAPPQQQQGSRRGSGGFRQVPPAPSPQQQGQRSTPEADTTVPPMLERDGGGSSNSSGGSGTSSQLDTSGSSSVPGVPALQPPSDTSSSGQR